MSQKKMKEPDRLLKIPVFKIPPFKDSRSPFRIPIPIPIPIPRFPVPCYKDSRCVYV